MSTSPQQPLEKAALEKTKQEEHFLEIADNYVRSRREYIATRMYHQYWDDRLHALIDPKFGRSARYLDPMCGAGLFLETPLARFDEVHACDLSAKMLDYILPEDRSQLSSCGVQDVRALPFADNHIDIVLIRGGLHHVANFLPEVFAEIFRVLKPGGQFIFSEPIDTGLIVKIIRHLMYTKTGIFEPDDERGLTVDEVKRLSDEAGFSDLFYEPFTHAAYTVIGNTDFFYPMPWLTNKTLINALIGFDEVSKKIPIWNQLDWKF